MRGRLPDAIIDRGKRGFGVPLNSWLRRSLAPMVREYLDPARLSREGTFEPSQVASIVDDHLSGAHDRGQELWLLLQFQLWRERWRI
jgi:asparagine synthase (glutamine-hydrolysing)